MTKNFASYNNSALAILTMPTSCLKYGYQNVTGNTRETSKLVSRELKFRYAWSVFNEFLWRAYYQDSPFYRQLPT